MKKKKKKSFLDHFVYQLWASLLQEIKNHFQIGNVKRITQVFYVWEFHFFTWQANFCVWNISAWCCSKCFHFYINLACFFEAISYSKMSQAFCKKINSIFSLVKYKPWPTCFTFWIFFFFLNNGNLVLETFLRVITSKILIFTLI